MSFNIPDDRRYIETHEWAQQRDGVVRVGISDFAQDELGDVVFVEFPADGTHFDRSAAFGVVESIKAVSDLYTPIAGTVVTTNEALLDAPELVNESPYGDGWMVELDPDDGQDFEDLMTASEYRQQIE